MRRLGLLERIRQIISTYFIEETGYNPLNTIVYSLIGLVLIFLIIRLVEFINSVGRKRWPEAHIDIFPDRWFGLALIPYIMMGSVMRALNDTDIITTRLLETPLIFFLIIILALSALIISYLIGVQTMKDWRWGFGGIGFVVLLFPVVQIGFLVENWKGGLQVGAIAGLWVAGLITARYLFGKRYFSDENLPVLATQMFDASSTFVAVTWWGYIEKHVLPSFLFEQLGTWIFFPIKFFLVLGALISFDYLLEEDPILKRWLKVVIFLFGMATGMRDLLRLMMMT